MQASNADSIRQLSVITDEIGQEIEEFLPKLKDHGVKAVEIRTVWKKNIIDFTDEELDRLASLLREHDMVVSNVAVPLFKCIVPWSWLHRPGSDSFLFNVQKSRDSIERAVEIARRLGCDKTRAFGYLMLRNGRVKPEHWQVLVDDLARYVDVAKSEKVTVVLENEMSSPVAKLSDVKRILTDIDDPYFKLILDPGNFYFAGEIHEPSEYDSIVDRVAHHHVKDPKKILGIKYFSTVGEGVLDYSRYFKYWISKGFDGFFSLETHALVNKAAISYKSLKNMRKMLGGM